MSETMRTSEVLRKAKALIDTPEKWWKNEKNPGGLPLSLHHVGICAGQAVSLVDDDSYQRCARLLMGSSIGLTLPRWNDAPGRTHAEVMDAFDKAIQLAEQEESTP